MNYLVSTNYNQNTSEVHYLYKVYFYNVSSVDLVDTFYQNFNNDYLNLDLQIEFRPSNNNQIRFNYELNYFSCYANQNLMNAISFEFNNAESIKIEGNNPINDVLDVPSSQYLNWNYSTYGDLGFSFTINAFYEDNTTGDTEQYDQGYNNGYSTGYTYGYDQGYDSGYSVGQNSGNDYTGVFGLLGQAFGSAKTLMDAQFIGGLSIGAFITIPIAITVLVAIFRMLRK